MRPATGVMRPEMGVMHAAEFVMRTGRGVTLFPNGVTQFGTVVMYVATGVSRAGSGVMYAGMLVMQCAMEEANAKPVVYHGATLCSRIPAGVSATGSAALHGTSAAGHGSAVARCVSYVVGDGAVLVCTEETGVFRFRPVVPCVPVVVVLLALFVSHRVHNSAGFRPGSTRDRVVAWPSPSSAPSAPVAPP